MSFMPECVTLFSPSSCPLSLLRHSLFLARQTYLRHLELPEHYEASRAFHAVGAAVMELLLIEAKVHKSKFSTVTVSQTKFLMTKICKECREDFGQLSVFVMDLLLIPLM